jgi:hypothetical protein
MTDTTLVYLLFARSSLSISTYADKHHIKYLLFAKEGGQPAYLSTALYILTNVNY